MQNNIPRHEQEKLEADLKLLNLRLATAEAEYEKIHQELLSIESSQAMPGSNKPGSNKPGSNNPGRGFTVATASVFAVITLSFVSVYHDAYSNVTDNSQYEVSAMRELVNVPVERSEYQATNSKLSSGRTFRTKTATKQQWGPSLLLPQAADKKHPSVFNPIVKQQQINLLTLGFDIGKADGFKGALTRQAIAEFRALYLPDSAKQLKDAELAVILANYANLASSDAARFGIDHGIVAAIRLSSIRTGVDFSYLMKLAATESSFGPASEAATSSATGIYQFTHDTWLNTIKTHGAKYGLVAEYAANIEYYKTRYGHQRPTVRDETMYQHLLELRKNPRVSAIMAAETVRDNQQILAYSFDREPTETDLYLTHFLGTRKAITFLQSLQQTPNAPAVELFPRAASSNHDIFHPRTCAPRTVDEVYSYFGEKFSTRRYDIATN